MPDWRWRSCPPRPSGTRNRGGLPGPPRRGGPAPEAVHNWADAAGQARVGGGGGRLGPGGAGLRLGYREVRRGTSTCPGRGLVGGGDRRPGGLGGCLGQSGADRQRCGSQPSGAGYRNPLRGVGGLVPERIDDGVNFTGLGQVYALGDAVVTSATGTNFGWPGGGWITYRLTGGPAAGLVVYVAEDITPAVAVGRQGVALHRDRHHVRRRRRHRNRVGTANWPVRRVAAPASRGHRRARPVPDQDRGGLRPTAPLAGSARRAQPHPARAWASPGRLPANW